MTARHTRLSQRWLVSRFPGADRRACLGSGALAPLRVLASELPVAIHLRSLGISEYIASRDPVSRSVYSGMLLVPALMPWFLARCEDLQSST